MNVSTMEEYLDGAHLFINLAKISYILKEGIKLDNQKGKLSRSDRCYIKKIEEQVTLNMRANLGAAPVAIALDRDSCLRAFSYLVREFEEEFSLLIV